MTLLSALFFPPLLPKKNRASKKISKNTTMSQDTPLPPLPDAPSEHRFDAGALDVAFDAMLLDPTIVADCKFSDDWGATDTKDALALSSVEDARLKDCISAASASV
jgi:hypothetical protein